MLRLLDVVRRDLGADDVRAEVGGREPDDPKLLWCTLPGGLRIVACFDVPPEDPEGLSERLRTLTQAFTGVTPPGGEWVTLSQELASRRLDDELEVLVDRAGAVRAVVIDIGSPVIWGSSGMLRGNEGVDTALSTAGAVEDAEAAGVDLAEILELEPDAARARLEQGGIEARVALSLARAAERIRRESRRSGAAWRHYLLTSRAIAAVRKQTADASGTTHLKQIVRGERLSYLVRGLASIYCLILVFEGSFSELHAESAVMHALPVIERMVLSLPPIDPPPKAREGKVVQLKPR